MSENGKFEALEEYAECLRQETKKPGILEDLGCRFVVIWSMMTRIPLPQSWFPQRVLLPTADAMVILPLVGGVLGFVATLPAFLLALLIPPLAGAWIACGIYTFAGWSLHIDGWGDLWDGIGSGKRGEAMRTIMKDSRTGAFGVIGIVLALATRASLLASIDVMLWVPVCIAACGAGRFASSVAAFFGKYPWEAGMGRNFVKDFGGYQLFCAFLAACILFPFAPLGWIIGIVLASLVGAGLAFWSNQNIGGTNGDVLGAAAVAGELLVLMACTI